MQRAPTGPFRVTLRAFPVSFLENKEHLENGGKIILPPSALEDLIRREVTYPMLFELRNNAVKISSHCGVLEFIAPEGKCYVPFWMMENLHLEAGDIVDVINVTLPKGKFVQFQPQSPKFMELSNPRAVLEKTLREFSALTRNEIVCVNYNGRSYQLLVQELQPANAVSIVETDISVDFSPAPGTEKATRQNSQSSLNPYKVIDPITSSSVADPAAVTPQVLRQRPVGALFMPLDAAMSDEEGEDISSSVTNHSSTDTNSGQSGKLGSGNVANFVPFGGAGHHLKTGTKKGKERA